MPVCGVCKLKGVIGANQTGDRAGLGGLGSAVHAICHRLAVVDEGSVEQNDLAARLAGTLLEVLEASDHEHRRGDALLRGGDAAAQAQHRQLLARGFEQFGRFLAPHPMRHHDVFAVHIFKSVCLHFGQRPINGGFEVRRAAEARAKRVAKFGQPLEGKVRLRRRANEFVGGGLIVGQFEERSGLRLWAGPLYRFEPMRWCRTPAGQATANQSLNMDA